MTTFSPVEGPKTISDLLSMSSNRDVRVRPPLIPRYFDAEGSPVLQLESGYFSALKATLALGPLYNREAAGPARLFLNSGAAWAASKDPSNVRLPINITTEGLVQTPQGPMEPSGASFYQGMSPATQALLGRYNFGEDQFKDLTFDEAANKYKFIATEINLQGVIQSYTKGETSLGLLGGSFVTDVFTDPTTLALAMISGGGSIAAKVATTGGRTAATAARMIQVTERAVQSAAARKILVHAGNFSIGAATSALDQYARNTTLHSFHMDAPDGISAGETLIGGTMGLALGAVFMGAFSGLGKAAKITKEQLNTWVGTSSRPDAALAWADRQGLWLRGAAQTVFPELDGMEKVKIAEDLMYSNYGEYGSTLFKEAIQLGRYDSEKSLDNLINRLLQTPDADEVLGELAGEYSLVQTRLESLMNKALIQQAKMRDPKLTAEAFLKMKRAETKIQEEIQEIHETLAKQINDIANDSKSKEIVDPGILKILERQRDNLQSRPQINTGRFNAAAQAKIWDHLVQGDWARIWRAPLGTLARIGYRTGLDKVLINAADAGTGKAAVRAVEHEYPIQAALAQLVDPSGMYINSMDLSKGSAPSLQVQYIRGLRKANQEVIAVSAKLHEKYNKDPKARNRAYRQAFINAGSNKLDSGDEAVDELARAWRSYFDSMGIKGLQNGAIGSYQENYLPIYLNNVMLQRHGGVGVLGDRLAEWYLNHYTTSDEIHYGTWLALLDSDHVKTRLLQKYKPEDLDILATTIHKRSELEALDPVLYDEYMRSLEDPQGLLTTSALKSIERRNGEDPRELHERQSDTGAFDAIRSHPDERRTRAIEQNFWLQPDFLLNGIVEYEPSTVIFRYVHRGGYRIFEQDSINALTGSNTIGWGGISRWLDEQSVKDPKSADINKYIQIKRDQIRGVNIDRKNDGLDVVYQPLKNITTGGVNAGVGMSVANVELPLQIINMLYTPQAIGQFFSRFIRGSTTDLLEATGRTITKIRRQNRFILDYAAINGGDAGYTTRERLGHAFKRPLLTFQDPEIFTTANPSPSRTMQTITSATESFAEIMRIAGFEEFVTDTVRIAAYEHSFVKFAKNHERLLKYDLLAKNFTFDPDPIKASKQFASLARQAGFSNPEELTRYIRTFGDRWTQNIRVIASLKEQGFKEWSDVHAYQRMVAGIKDPGDRQRMDELLNSLLDKADVDVRFASPEATVSDYMLNNANAISDAAMQFTTFARAFFSKKLAVLAQQPLTNSVPYLVINIMLEAMLLNNRAMLYGGMSKETLAQEWEDDPERMMLMTLTRIPWLGPWTDIAVGVAGNMLSEHQYSAFGSSMVGRAVDDFTDLTRKAGMYVSGQEVDLSARDYRAIDRYAPFWNLPYVRMIERSLSGYEDKDQD